MQFPVEGSSVSSLLNSIFDFISISLLLPSSLRKLRCSFFFLSALRVVSLPHYMKRNGEGDGATEKMKDTLSKGVSHKKSDQKDILNFQSRTFLRILGNPSGLEVEGIGFLPVPFLVSGSEKIDNFPHINKTTSFFYFIFIIIPWLFWWWFLGKGGFWDLGTRPTNQLPISTVLYVFLFSLSLALSTLYLPH